MLQWMNFICILMAKYANYTISQFFLCRACCVTQYLLEWSRCNLWTDWMWKVFLSSLWSVLSTLDYGKHSCGAAFCLFSNLIIFLLFLLFYFTVCIEKKVIFDKIEESLLQFLHKILFNYQTCFNEKVLCVQYKLLYILG